MHQCKKYIQIVHKGKPTFYKLGGIDLPHAPKPITDGDMGVGPNPLENYLKNLSGHALKIHDIKVRFNDPNLHGALVDRGHKPHSSNKCIVLYIPVSARHASIKAVIYPKTAQIHITGTHSPIIYDYREVLDLSVILGQVSAHLSGATGCYALEHVNTWVVYHYHMSVDMIQRTVGKRDVEIDIEEFGDTLLRFYTKSMPNGLRIGRFEKICTEKKTVEQEFSERLAAGDRGLL